MLTFCNRRRATNEARLRRRTKRRRLWTSLHRVRVNTRLSLCPKTIVSDTIRKLSVSFSHRLRVNGALLRHHELDPLLPCLFLFSDLLLSAFEAVGPLSALSATQLEMLRSSLLSADCNSIFLLRFSHENLPTLFSWTAFPPCFTHTVLFQHARAPTFSLTHATVYLFTYFWQMHTHVHRCWRCSTVGFVRFLFFFSFFCSLFWTFLLFDWLCGLKIWKFLDFFNWHKKKNTVSMWSKPFSKSRMAICTKRWKAQLEKFKFSFWGTFVENSVE